MENKCPHPASACACSTSPGGLVTKWIKTVVSALLLAFGVYYLYTRPEAAADFVKAIFGIFDSIGRFFESLVR